MYSDNELSCTARWLTILIGTVPAEMRSPPIGDGLPSLDDLVTEMRAHFRADDDTWLERHHNDGAISVEGRVYLFARWNLNSMFNLPSCAGRWSIPPNQARPDDIYRALQRYNTPFNIWFSNQMNKPSNAGILEMGELLPWEPREITRLDYGNYLKVPWKDSVAPIAGHHVHISKRDMGLVAFTENATQGERNRKKTMRPGRYLTEFYKELGEQRIQSFATMMGANYALKFAKTPDEIEEVYTSGPNSCMSSRADSYQGPEHPVRVYGDSPDLELAYLVEGDKAKPLARCLVWPEKKVIGRVYGDFHRIKYLLEDLGYDCSDASGCALSGAKIRKIKDPAHGCLVMPYIDGTQRYDVVDDNWCKIGGNRSACFTNGLDREICEDSDDDDSVMCDYCEDHYHSDDVTRIETSETSHALYCRSCRDEHTSRSGMTNRFILDEHMVEVQVNRRSGERVEEWAQWEADDRARHCDGLEMFAFGYEMRDLADGRTVSDFWLRTHGVEMQDADGKRVWCERVAIPDGLAPIPPPVPVTVPTAATMSLADINRAMETFEVNSIMEWTWVPSPLNRADIIGNTANFVITDEVS